MGRAVHALDLQAIPQQLETGFYHNQIYNRVLGYFFLLINQLGTMQDNDTHTEDEDLRILDNQVLDRLDGLPLAKWHLFVMMALGLVWIFDGYEVTLISIYRPQIEKEHSENMFKSLVSAYQFGGMVGSLVFGVLAFVVGRRKIFLITLALYFFGVLLSGIDIHPFLFIIARFITGLSVGGEFTAIFTGIDEFMPPSYRGRVNIGIDGTWHLGGTLASLLTMVVDQSHWRSMFLLGWVGIIALGIMRKNVPQSPRWLLLKGYNKQAAAIVSAIVLTVSQDRIHLLPIPTPSTSDNDQLSLNLPRANKTCLSYLKQILSLLKEGITRHPRKFFISFTLIFTQALFFNLIYYQYPSILSNSFHLSQEQVSVYMLPLSVVSFVSTIVIGPFFDKVGRRKLLLLTYCSSGILLLVVYSMQELAWREVLMCVLFIFASPAGSSANLIASEIFPTSSRTIMLFVMFIVSMLGGSVGVWFDNYVVAALMMFTAGVLGFLFCPNSENKTLEQIEKL